MLQPGQEWMPCPSPEMQHYLFVGGGRLSLDLGQNQLPSIGAETARPAGLVTDAGVQVPPWACESASGGLHPKCLCFQKTVVILTHNQVGDGQTLGKTTKSGTNSHPEGHEEGGHARKVLRAGPSLTP